jgi:hypothetical protein
MRRLSLLPLCLLAACATAASGPSSPARPGFRYVAASGTTLRVAAPLGLRIAAGRGFRATRVESRLASFGGHPYEVSLAALLSDEGAVMVHGERVADGSGASDYDSLPRAGWPDERFGVRRMCAAIDAATAAAEHDLAFLARHGWSPVGTLALEQYLATTADHDREVVVSLVVRVEDCGRTEEVAARLARLRGLVSVSRR